MRKTGMDNIIGSVIGDAFGRAILKAPAPKPVAKPSTLAIWMQVPAVLAVVLTSLVAVGMAL